MSVGELPDLESPEEFHLWFREQKQHSSADELLELLKVSTSDLSLLRQINIVCWGNTWNDYRRICDNAYKSKNFLVEGFAVAVDTYLDIANFNKKDSDYNLVAMTYLPMLKSYQDRLRTQEQTWLCREVQAMVHISTGLAYFFLRQFENCTKEASQAIFWSSKVGATYTLALANSLLLATYSNTGQNEMALGLVSGFQKNEADRANVIYQAKAYAELLFYLGHTQKSVDLLNECLDVFNPNPVAGVHGALMRSELLLGTGGLDTDNRDEDATHTWIVNSAKCLVQYRGLPRTSQTSQERIQLLQKATDIWQHEGGYKLEWGTTTGLWLAGTSYLWQRRTINALNTVNLVPDGIYKTQWFDLRVLLVGLKLELALTFQNSNIGITMVESELKTLFDEARALEFAYPKGLAERLRYWHPLAAAYGAVMPDGIEELQEATHAIIRMGNNSVQNHNIPPTFAAELALRSLGFDDQSTFVQADLGGNRLKRNLLSTKHGKNRYVLPAISATQIVYGLVKGGHLDRARATYIEYGIAPQSSAEYVMLPMLERVNGYTRQLLSSEISLSEFEATILNLD
ncbi:MAG: hypothetical protein ACRCYY_21455 [Trueperaceae bacterium]